MSSNGISACDVCGAPATRRLSINNGDAVISANYCTEHYQKFMNEVNTVMDSQLESKSDIHHSKDDNQQ